jgi:2-haloacid dehalogenase
MFSLGHQRGPGQALQAVAESYQLAVTKMKLRKEEILFVSSNSFDVVGAKSFGFKVCWINRTGAPLDPLGPKPDLVVRTIDELSTELE